MKVLITVTSSGIGSGLAKEYFDTQFISFAPGLVDSEIQKKIYSIKKYEKYPTVKRLQQARYTELMPGAIHVAFKLIRGFQNAIHYVSGSFVDVREMD